MAYESYVGVTHRFEIDPLVSLIWETSTHGKSRAWIIRPEGDKRRRWRWMLSSKTRLPQFYASSEVPIPEFPSPTQLFRTLKAARAEAQRLAAEEKTLALLQGKLPCRTR